jgi:hypothetical protein
MSAVSTRARHYACEEKKMIWISVNDKVGSSPRLWGTAISNALQNAINAVHPHMRGDDSRAAQ